MTGIVVEFCLKPLNQSDDVFCIYMFLFIYPEQATSVNMNLLSASQFNQSSSVRTPTYIAARTEDSASTAMLMFYLKKCIRSLPY